MPTATPFVRHDIDHTSNGIGTESDRNNTFVHLDAFGEIGRNIVQVERLTCPFLRHAVDEYFDMFAAESVEHQLHIGAHASRFSKFHAGQLREGIAQALRRVLQGSGIYRHRIERGSSDATYASSRDGDLLKLRRLLL